MKILVTAGPTHEYLDDVRYLGNAGSGRLGFTIAEVARDRGHEVLLVTGPTALPDPPGVLVTRVVSARDMLAACVPCFADAGGLIMTAAVADYRPRERIAGKIKKDRDELSLALVKNPDVVAELGRMSRGQVIVGFALEAAPHDEAEQLARGKLRHKRLDLVVLNRPGSLGGADAVDVTLITEREAVSLGNVDKRQLGEILLRFVESRRITTET